MTCVFFHRLTILSGHGTSKCIFIGTFKGRYKFVSHSSLMLYMKFYFVNLCIFTIVGALYGHINLYIKGNK